MWLWYLFQMFSFAVCYATRMLCRAAGCPTLVLLLSHTFTYVCLTDKSTPRRMTSLGQEIDGLKADIEHTKQELASTEDLAHVDFHRKRLLYLENQLSSLREQQTILLRSRQLCFSSPPATSTGALNDRQVDQQPAATEKAAGQVVEALHSHGFAWLKIYKSEPSSFHQLQQYTSEPDSCLQQATPLLSGKGWCGTIQESQIPHCRLPCAQQQTG